MEKVFSENIIIITSNEVWGQMWFSKHHYANELAKDNIVLFINPPTEWSIKSIFNFGKVTIKEVCPNLFVCNYSNFVPTLGQKNLLKLNDFLVFRQFRRIIAKFKRTESKIVYFSFNIFSLIHPEFLKPDYSAFYSVDWYHHPNEFLVASKVDRIFVVSQKMQEKLGEFAEKVSYIPHGIPRKVFEVEKGFDKNKVVFGGTIDERVNLDLLLNLAEHFPQCKLYLAGKLLLKNEFDLGKWQKLVGFENVKFLNVLSFNEMIDVFSDANICLAPYKNQFNEENVANLGSLKVYQYLGLGKKVLSPYLAEFMTNETEGLITMYQDQADAQQKFSDLLNRPEEPTIIEKRVAFARKLSYLTLIEKMEEAFK